MKVETEQIECLDTTAIPIWSLNYIMNGDWSDLDDSYVVIVDDWLKEFGCAITLNPLMDTDYFTECNPFPEFGPMCNTMECEIWGHPVTEK